MSANRKLVKKGSRPSSKKIDRVASVTPTQRKKLNLQISNTSANPTTPQGDYETPGNFSKRSRDNQINRRQWEKNVKVIDLFQQ